MYSIGVMFPSARLKTSKFLHPFAVAVAVVPLVLLEFQLAIMLYWV